MADVRLEALKRTATADEREQVRRQQEPGVPVMGRAARLPGYLNCAPTMGGNFSCVVVGASIGLPQPDRARARAIDAGNRATLARLWDRVVFKRDSILADSLRRDSVARAAQQRTKPPDDDE
jgi:hypothetical protein